MLITLQVSLIFPESPYGGIDLPPDEFYQIHVLSSRHLPPPRPDNPSKPPFNNQDLKSPSKDMMTLSIYHHKFLNCIVEAIR